MFEKITQFISYFYKSKTLITMMALAILPALNLLGQIDMQNIVASVACGEEQAKECVEGFPAKFDSIYMLVIVGAAKILRFVTNTSLKDK